MAELKKLFVGAKMDKDSDERFVAAGDYVDAFNIDILHSEGGDGGVVRNKQGNILVDLDFGLVTPKCVGIFKNTPTDCIYYFIVSATTGAILEYNSITGITTKVLSATASLLGWTTSTKITGIQMIENQLGWCVKGQEPCIINVDSQKVFDDEHGDVTELSSITMMKLSPLDAPSMTLATSERGGVVSAVTIKNFTTTQVNNGALAAVSAPGTAVSFTISAGSAFIVGDKVKLITPASSQNAEEGDYEITVVLTSVTVSGSVLAGKIANSSSLVEDNALAWDVDLVDSKPLYELVFPRFAYRWKYENGQYSTISPFTKTAFLPGEFLFNSQKGYNVGMTNNVRKITLSGFSNGAPADVVELDILYKESNSPTVYVVDTIDGFAPEFTITSELLRNAIEASQLLRPWDAVPKSALALEAISNRFVLGNYKKGYDVSGDIKFAEAFATSTIVAEVGMPEESLKSLRTYQAGVVFKDAMGRETPVISSPTGVVKTNLEDASTANRLQFKMLGNAPTWATHFKYFIKDTANEYYNLAADRLYQSEDKLATWISFPSSERNKVTIDSYLIAKKNHDEEVAVTDTNNRFKIIDIQAEAPTEIAKVKEEVAERQIWFDKNFGDGNAQTVMNVGSTPVPNSKVFLIASDKEDADAGITSILLDTLVPGSYIRFDAGGASYSKYYKISSVLKSKETPGVFYGLIDRSEIHAKVYVTEAFGEDIHFLYTDPTAVNPTLVNDRVTLAVYTDQEVADQEQFTGRFFVKLASNVVLNDVFPTSDVFVTLNAANCYTGGYTNGDVNFKIHAGGAFPRKGYTIGFEQGGLDIARNPIWADDDVNDTIYDIVFEKRHRTPLDNSFVASINTVGTKIKFSNHATVYTITESRSQYTSYASGNYTRYFTEFDKRLTESVSPHVTGLDVTIEIVGVEDLAAFTSKTPAIFETEPVEQADFDVYHEASNAFDIADYNTLKTLEYYNCFAFGNGVESNRIRDDFNAVTIDKGPKVSTVLDEPIVEEHIPNGLIFSGLYNSTSGVNNLNQFLIAEKITKEVNPLYGSIQKLHARDSDMIVACEDKILQILANKDALYNADGSSNVALSTSVLGSIRPFAGEFGISKDPASFASYGFRSYFTDKRRGVVLRLSRDGITPIVVGYENELELQFKSADAIVGSYNDELGYYNVTMNGETLQYSEKSKGWVSRWGINPENGITINNTYYTTKEGRLWKHSDLLSRNSWYGGAAQVSSIQFVYNNSPSTIKKFKTLSYEGDTGWVASEIKTDQEAGTVTTWVTREGKHYNYIKGVATAWGNQSQSGNLDTKEFAVQGIGNLVTITGDLVVSEFTINVFDDPSDH